MDMLREYVQIAFSDYWNYFYVYEEGDRLTEKEGEILTLFSLPVCHYYSGTMRVIIAEKEKDIECVDTLYKFLINESTYYALRTITDREKLLNANKYLVEANEILKSLLISYNSYLGFIYHDLFLENKIKVDEMLYCIEFYRKNEKSGLRNLYQYHELSEKAKKIDAELFLYLREIQTPYIDAFILENTNQLISDNFEPDDYKEWYSLSETEFNQLILNNFQVLYITPLHYLQLYFLHITFKDNENILNRAIVIAKFETVVVMTGYSENSFESTIVSENLEDKNLSSLDLSMLLSRDGLTVKGLSLTIIREPKEKIFIVDNIEKL